MLPMWTLYSWYQYESLRKRCKSKKMAEGFMNIFGNAQVNQPKAIYIDYNCLSPGKLADLLANSLTRQTRICHSVSLWTKNSSYTPPTVGYFPWENVRLNPRIGQYWLCLDSESQKESTKVRAWATNQGLIITVKDAWYTLGAPFLLPTMEEILAT